MDLRAAEVCRLVMRLVGEMKGSEGQLPAKPVFPMRQVRSTDDDREAALLGFCCFRVVGWAFLASWVVGSFKLLHAGKLKCALAWRR